MNDIKIGELILRLRKENNLTQKDLANLLNISDKTVSKWECNAGLPDITFLSKIADVFNISVDNLLYGDNTTDMKGITSMRNTKFYYCRECGNIISSMTKADISCCLKKLEALDKAKEDDKHMVEVKNIEDEWLISSNHPMDKDHYITFMAFVNGSGVNLIKLFPEWDFEYRVPVQGKGILYYYCTKHGLFYKAIK